MATLARPLPRECRRDDGRPKFRYETRADAKRVARTHVEPVRVYRCGYCGYFHIATRKATS
jgi:hypothetical protein